MNKIENRKTIEQISMTKSWCFEKTCKIDKTLPRLTKKKKQRTQITKITTIQIKKIIEESYAQFYANKLDNLYEMSIFIDRHKTGDPDTTRQKKCKQT